MIYTINRVLSAYKKVIIYRKDVLGCFIRLYLQWTFLKQRISLACHSVRRLIVEWTPYFLSIRWFFGRPHSSLSQVGHTNNVFRTFERKNLFKKPSFFFTQSRSFSQRHVQMSHKTLPKTEQLVSLKYIGWNPHGSCAGFHCIRFNL